MSGETEQNISGWTVDTLRTHIDDLMVAHDRRYEQRFVAQEKANFTALQAADRAVNKAELAAEKRFDSVNEFRQTLSDQARDLMPRLEYEQAHKALSEKVNSLASRFENNDGRTTGIQDGWKYLLGAISLIATVLAIVATVIAVTR